MKADAQVGIILYIFQQFLQEQQNLANAAKAVANATFALVSAAKKALEPVEAEETTSGGTVLGGASNFDWELEKQIEIEKLEAQLRRTRNNMQKLHSKKT